MMLRRHRLFAGLGLIAALALGLAATLLTVERSIRLDSLRERVVEALGRALGGDVHVDGPLYLLTGLHPGIEVEGLRLAGRAGAVRWSAGAREGRLRLDLRALLARRIEISTLDLEDVQLCVAPSEGGGERRDARGGAGWRFAGIERLRARRVSIVANASCAGEPLAGIDSLEAGVLAAQPLHLTASGSVNAAPWRVELRGPPWSTLADAGAAPFELSAELAGAQLKGTFQPAPSPASVRAQLTLDADDFLPLTRLVGAPFKSFGPMHARARLEADAAHIDLHLDEARIAPAALAGRFALDRSGARPRAEIELHADAVDAVALQRWFQASLDRARAQPGRLMRRIAGAVRASDGALSLRFARIDVGPVALQGVAAEGDWGNGVLRAKLVARDGTSPLDGTLEADMRGEEVAVVLEAQANTLALPKLSGIVGSVAGVRAKLTAQAAPGALWPAVRGTLELRDARLRLPFAGGRLPPLVVASARVEWPGGGKLRANATGSMGELRAQAQGQVGFGARHPTADLAFTARAGAVAGLPLDARGLAHLGEADWRLDLTSVSLGRTRARASLAGALPLSQRPIAARAEFDLLDLAQLVQRKPRADSRLWDRELLPSGVRLPDADVEIEAARVVLPRNGSMRASGKASLRGRRVAATLVAQDLSLPQFGAAVGRATLEASASGATLAALAADAKLGLEARDGRLVIQAGDTPLEASITQARLAVTPGARTTLNAVGTFVDSQLELRASAAPLATLLPAADGEFDVSGHLGEVAVSAAWQRDAPLRVKLDAPRLDAFNGLVARKLPQVGPVSLEATVHGLGTPQRSAEAALALGESRVNGRIIEAHANGRRRVDAALESPLLRLQDFGLQQDAEQTEREAGTSVDSMEAKLARQLKRAQAQVAVLRRALREFDGRFALDAERVTAGAAELGRGELRAVLEQGRLRVAPLKLDSPKGKLSLALEADLSTEISRYRVDGELDDFRYGALLKGTEAANKAEGGLNMKFELAARGPLDALAPNVAGKADFTVFPTDYTSRALELWGGGLMRSMGAVLDKEKGARINCAVAAFDIAGGVAKSAALLIDSTTMRAAGELEVDLLSHRLKGFMAPKSKGPRLLSPLVPVGIGGTLEKPEVGVEVTGIPLAAVRSFYFVPTYLYDSFFSGSMPADGSEDCIRAYRRISTK
jgi:uncharacterized protein involved in outer membrane biogenesis